MGNLGILPSEIISLIISHLSQTTDIYNCTLINKSFHATANPLLWHTRDMKHESCFVKMNMDLQTSQHGLGHHIRCLGLDNSATDHLFLGMMKHIPLLETLKIHKAPFITDSSIHHLGYHCPHLHSVVLHGVLITSLSVISLAQTCRQLCTLVLRDTLPLLPAIFPAIAHHPIQTLDISACRPASIYRPDWITGLDTLAGLHRLSCLTSLRLFSISWVGDIGANVLRTAAAWPRLTKLVLYGCRGVTTAQLATFFQTHPNLVELDLNALPATTDAFTPIARYLPGIQSLQLGSHCAIKPRALRHFIHQCPALTYICFWNDAVYSRRHFPGVFETMDNESLAVRLFDDSEYLEDLIISIRRQPDPGQGDDDHDDSSSSSSINDSDNSNMDDSDDHDAD